MAESAQSQIEKDAKKKKKGRPIIIKKKKGGHGGAHGGSWKVAYADFVTAMMAFFLLMWLLSSVNQDTKEKLSAYFQDPDAFSKNIKGQGDNSLSISNTNKLGVPDITLSKTEKLRYSIVMKIKDFISQEKNLTKSAEASSDGKGVLFYVDSELMFQGGSASLRPESYTVLNHVVAILKEFNFDLVIRGHTDDQEVSSSSFPSNWELSAARAAGALRYLLKNGGIPASRLRAVGYADSRPLVPNNSPENRARNRRIEFYYHRPDEQSW